MKMKTSHHNHPLSASISRDNFNYFYVFTDFFPFDRLLIFPHYLFFLYSISDRTLYKARNLPPQPILLPDVTCDWIKANGIRVTSGYKF